MADDAVGATNPQVMDMVNETVAGQSVEIDRMQAVLADLAEPPAAPAQPPTSSVTSTWSPSSMPSARRTASLRGST